jgi:hypothetical protein
MTGMWISPVAPHRPALADPPAAAFPIAVALVIVAVAVLEPRVGPNIALVDPLLAVVLLVGLVLMARGAAEPALTAWRWLRPWLLMIALGTVLSLYSSGITDWATINIAQSVYAVAAFFGLYAVFSSRPSLIPVFGVAIAVGVVVTTVALALTWQPGVRPAGLFYHPNYAGHYLVTSAFVGWSAVKWPWLKILIVVTAAAGVFLTASFGAIVMFGTFVVFFTVREARRRPWVLAYGTAAVALALWLGGPAIISALSDGFAASDTLTSERLARSGAGRFALWQESLDTVPDHPLGVGPDGLHNRGLITVASEPHNLYVAFLAERGAVGLVGLIGLGIGLWRLAPPGGIARPLLIALATANLVRETFHYRHMWLCLALALAIDIAAERRSGS